MKFFSLIFSLTLLSHTLWSYEDSDIDGVDDTIDLCPDTAFDKLVDENGCPSEKSYWGDFTLQIGSDISIDEDNNQINNYSFLGSYGYKMWNFSFSNSQQTSYDNKNNRSINGGDLYLTLGYQLNHNKFQTNISLGTKIATANRDIGTGENDYFSSIEINYLINEQFMIHTQLGYSVTGDSSAINYQNSWTSSFGLGSLFTSQWYSTLSYDFAQSIYRDSPNYQALSWLNSYSFLEDYFINIDYSHGLDKLSYPHTFSLQLGVIFE